MHRLKSRPDLVVCMANGRAVFIFKLPAVACNVSPIGAMPFHTPRLRCVLDTYRTPANHITRGSAVAWTMTSGSSMLADRPGVNYSTH